MTARGGDADGSCDGGDGDGDGDGGGGGDADDSHRDLSNLRHDDRFPGGRQVTFHLSGVRIHAIGRFNFTWAKRPLYSDFMSEHPIAPYTRCS